MEPDRPSDYGRLFALSSELLATIDRHGAFQMLNPAWHRVLGWSTDELCGRQTADFMHPDDRERTFSILGGMGTEVYDFENRYAHKRGGWRWLRWRAWSDGEVWFASASDVTENKDLELKALADPLTGLPNRLLLNDRLEHALVRLERAGGTVAVIFVDFDRFKVANDTLGHETGDALLEAAAERLSSTARGSDTVARLGGDEFVIVAEDLSGPGEAGALAQRIVGAFDAPLTVVGESFPLSASVGLALAARATAAPPRRCCARPTPRCTAPRARGATATRSSTTSCGPRWPTVWPSRWSCDMPSRARSWCSSISPWSACPMARWRPAKRCFAGITPSAAWLRRCRSSRSPRRAG